MAKIISLSLLTLCALLLPTYGQEAQPQSAGLKTGNAGAGSPGSGLNWLPGPGLGRRCQRRREVLKRCVSSTCGEYKCSDLYRFRERICTADCRTGCFCAWPFFRNNDGRCVHFWQCYSYRRPRWPAVRPSGGFDQGAVAYPGVSGSASLPGSSGGAGYGPQPGSDQGAGPSVGGWPSVPGLMPGGAGSNVNVVPSAGWSSGVGQYPGAWGGAAFPQYPGVLSSGFGNGVSGGTNGGLGAVNGGVGSGSGGFGVGSGNFGVSGGSLGGSSGVLGSGPGFGVGNGNFGVGGGSLGGSSGVFGSGPGLGGSTSGGFGSITGSGGFGSGNAGATNVKAQG